MGLTGYPTVNTWSRDNQSADPRSSWDRLGVRVRRTRLWRKYGQRIWQCLIRKVLGVLQLRRDFVLDPEGDASYLWLGVVASAVVYNIWSVILRVAFAEVRSEWVSRALFTFLDVTSDVIYLFDVMMQFRMGYLEDGILVQDPVKLAIYYMKRQRMAFILDVAAALPFPSMMFIFSGGVEYILSRVPKLLKCHSLATFLRTWEIKTNKPNMYRAAKLLLYLATTIHWIACMYYVLNEYEGLGSTEWTIKVPDSSEPFTFSRKYLRSIYWSTMILTTIGDTWGAPETNIEYIFTGSTFMIGVFIFATVVGNVGDVISNMNAARVDFQNKMDVIKAYMHHRGISDDLQIQVVRWAEYSWNRTQAINDQEMLEFLPLRLRAEIAKQVYLENLSKVKIFEECESGLLHELVVKLRSQIYSPGDYICRKGEIGREMYIINHGKVEVLIVTPDGEQKVVATLSEGNYFGEISLLKMEEGDQNNRRNADVRSVGYSELLVLSKRDLMQSLTEYPNARQALERQAKERLQKTRETEKGTSWGKGLSKLKIALRMQKNKAGLEAGLSSPGKAAASPQTGSGLTSATMSADINELKKVVQDLKALDALASKIAIEELQKKVTELEERLDAKNCELERARKRILRMTRQQTMLPVLESKMNGHATPTERLSYSSPSVALRRPSDGPHNGVAMVKPMCLSEISSSDSSPILKSEAPSRDMTSEVNTSVMDSHSGTLNLSNNDFQGDVHNDINNEVHNDLNSSNLHNDHSLSIEGDSFTPEGAKVQWSVSEHELSDAGSGGLASDTDLSTIEDD